MPPSTKVGRDKVKRPREPRQLQCNPTGAGPLREASAATAETIATVDTDSSDETSTHGHRSTHSGGGSDPAGGIARGPTRRTQRPASPGALKPVAGPAEEERSPLGLVFQRRLRRPRGGPRKTEHLVPTHSHDWEAPGTARATSGRSPSTFCEGAFTSAPRSTTQAPPS